MTRDGFIFVRLSVRQLLQSCDTVSGTSIEVRLLILEILTKSFKLLKTAIYLRSLIVSEEINKNNFNDNVCNNKYKQRR